MAATKPQVYQIKITLDSIRPPIWRCVLVPDKITLLELHDVIQDVFDWWDYHLHEFTIHDISYGDPANDEFDDLAIQDETKVKLRDLGLKEGTRFRYEYDFGDSWEHILRVEKVIPFEKGMKLPLCIKGKRARPPEDVGGSWGYEGFLEAIRDPENDEHDSYLEWVGGEFDPEAFDLEAANQRLRRRAKREWPGSIPSPNDDRENAQKILDPIRWANLFIPECEETARSLALRKDVITFLTYLKENKVTGTQATGNLPRKAIEEIAPRFVKPPVLETKIGGRVYRYRTEENVWPLYLIHALVQAAGLVDGGPARRWCLTDVGEQFLTLPEVVQVWELFSAWWYRVNWMIAYSFDIYGDVYQQKFPQTAATLLRALPVDEPQDFIPFADRLIEATGWRWPQQENSSTPRVLRLVIECMVIERLEEFEVLTTRRQKEKTSFYTDMVLQSFTLTKFGQVLLGMLF